MKGLLRKDGVTEHTVEDVQGPVIGSPPPKVVLWDGRAFLLQSYEPEGVALYQEVPSYVA